MKKPAKLVRTGLIFAALMAASVPGWTQEAGNAEKAGAVTFTELADRPPGTLRRSGPSHKRLQKDPRNLPVDKQGQQPTVRTASAEPQGITTVDPQTLPELSPLPSLSFEALPDSGVVAPPDTFGAVGPTHLVVACASEIRISDRAGRPISTRSQEVFWQGVGANIFDTRVVYDPYGQRFIMTAAADPGGADPRLCIAVSASSNPTGAWYRWSEQVDNVNPIYADSPTVGFNKTWIVVQANMYNKSTFEFFRSEVYAYNKANLYNNGTGQRTRLAFDPSMGGSQVPATTYDPATAVVYFTANWNGRFTNDLGGTFGYLRLFSLSGGIGSERLNVTNSFGQPIFVEIPPTWAESALNDADILPQLGTTTNVYAGDSRIQNVHFRDGLLYAAHTVFLPATAPTRAGVQWWVLTAGSGDIRHFGRVDDTNGVRMYAYPSIAANRYNDMLLGYSRFSPSEYPSAAYSFRQFNDGTDELRGEVVLKTGDAFYDEPIFGQNRWGDWSATTVDPVNDVDLWTIQEYAAPRESGRPRWGTWWGRVSPPVDLMITATDAPDPIPSGGQITYTLQVENKLEEFLSGVRVEDTLPPGVTFVSATPSKGSCGHTNGVLSCFIGSLTNFEQVTITLRADAGLPGPATNVATVFANGPDFDTSDNTAVSVTEIINSADLIVLGSDNPDPVHVGSPLTYTLSISNRGPSAAGGVVMTSTLPASITIGTITGPGFWEVNGNVVTFTLGSINNGGTALITIACTPNAAGMITNQVRVVANTFDIAPGNNIVNIATRANARPVISQLGTQTIDEDVATPIAITISDAETAATSLQFSASSSNQGLIPNANIVPGGSGQNRILTIRSAANQFGSNTTTITVTVTDGDGASTLMTFPINVAAVNDPPTISNVVAPAPISEDASTSVNFTIGDIDSPITSLTLAANSSNPTLMPVAGISFSPSGSSRVATLTPAPDRFGNSTITLTVSDGSLSASDTFVLTVNAVNDPPVVSSIDAQTTTEDTPTGTIPFTASDLETPATSLSVTATSSDTALVPNANIALVNQGTSRTVRVTPAANQNGTATITVRVSDGTNAVTTAFGLTVMAVNDRPTLADPSDITVSEDAGEIVVPLTGIGPGAANETQTLSVRASTSTGELVENLQIAYSSPDATGTLTFRTVAHAFGTALIDVMVSDGVAADDFGRQFQVTINPINDPPTIDAISNVTVAEDSGQRTITLTGITVGPANEAASQANTITAVSSARGIVPDPQITYAPGASTATLTFTPVANASGVATITVTVDDGRPLNPTTTQTFQITVDPVNDVPTISSLGNRTIDEDASAVNAFSFRDVEVGPLTVAVFSDNQSLLPDGNIALSGTGTNRTVTLNPLPNQFGTATITARVSDSEGGVANETFVLTVNAVNDPPTLAGIPNPAPIEEDSSLQTVSLAGITPGPPNETGQPVVITATSSNPGVVPHPTVNYTAPSGTGTLTYTPVANANGAAVITVTANDQQSGNNLATQTFTVQVSAVNDPPSIDGDFSDRETFEDVASSLTFTVGDVETAAGSLTLSGSSSNPELVAETGITFSGTGATRTVNVRPLTNEFGTAFISVTVTDGGGASTEIGFVLMVHEVDDSPVISTIGAQTIAEDSSTATLSFSVNDVDTSEDTLALTARSSDTSIVPDANIQLGGSGRDRTVRVTPAADANGAAQISITVADATSQRTTQFALTINPVNDSPSFDEIPPLNLLEDAGLQVLVLSNMTHGPANETADVLSVSATSSATGLIPHPAIANEGGVWKLRFTPVANASGTATITVTANDGRPLNPTTSKTFSVTVQPVNDPPTMTAVADVILNQNAPAQNVSLAGISAGGGETQPLNFTALSSNPTLVPHPTVSHTSGNSTAVLRLTVAPMLTGTATITVTLSDGEAQITQVFTVTVNEINDPPVFLSAPGNLATPEDTPVSAQFSIADEETYAAQLTLTATSTNTSLVPNGNIAFNGSDANRSITVTPALNQFGTTRITVTLSDGTNNVTTAFNVTVSSINDAPTLAPLPDISLTQNPPNQTISLTGIGAGAANESQTLSVRVTSGNTSLIPAPSSVSYTSPNPTGSFVLNPHNSNNGSSLMTVTVWDNGNPSNSISRTFTVYVRPSANALPTLTGLSNQSTPEDTPIVIPFVINDSVTVPADLQVGAYSSNPALVPSTGIVFSGTTANRSMTVTPHPDRTGSSTITVWVLDNQSGYTASNFVLQVTAVNDRPAISAIAPQTIARGSNMPPVAFTISDAETAAQSLTLSATSSNTGLLPNGNIFFGGSGTDRSVIAYPAAGQTGSTTITVTVTDANSMSASTAFVLTVRPPQPPRVTIRRAGADLEILWPVESGAYTLQGRNDLGAGSWTDIGTTPTVSGTNNVVSQPIVGPHKFFRLRN